VTAPFRRSPLPLLRLTDAPRLPIIGSRGVEQRQLVGLITRRSAVRIRPPQPTGSRQEPSRPGGFRRFRGARGRPVGPPAHRVRRPCPLCAFPRSGAPGVPLGRWSPPRPARGAPGVTSSGRTALLPLFGAPHAPRRARLCGRAPGPPTVGASAAPAPVSRSDDGRPDALLPAEPSCGKARGHDPPPCEHEERPGRIPGGGPEPDPQRVR
jgi:hypothetical protein